MATRNADLRILQGIIDGDGFEAAGRLAKHLEVHGNITNKDDDLSDWLIEGDYDGSETISSIAAEWNELQREAREARLYENKL